MSDWPGVGRMLSQVKCVQFKPTGFFAGQTEFPLQASTGALFVVTTVIPDQYSCINATDKYNKQTHKELQHQQILHQTRDPISILLTTI